MSGRQEDKSRVPSWAKDPFHQFNDQVVRLMQVVHLSRRGISSIIGMPDLVEALANLDEESLSDASEERIEQAK